MEISTLTADEFAALVKRTREDAYALELMRRRARGDVPSDDWFTGTQLDAQAIVNTVEKGQ